MSELELVRLLKYFGGRKTFLAEKLGVTKGAIGHYFKLGHVTAEMAIKIERLTEGEFKAVNLFKAD